MITCTLRRPTSSTFLYQYFCTFRALSYPGPLSIQQTPQVFSVQDADGPCPFHAARRLVHVHGLKSRQLRIPIYPPQRRFLQFGFQGYTVVPFGISLSPRVFVRCSEDALPPGTSEWRAKSTTGCCVQAQLKRRHGTQSWSCPICPLWVSP